MGSEKITMLLYVFYFFVVAIIVFISVSYYLKFKIKEKKENKKSIEPKNYFNDEDGIVEIKKNKEFDWDVHEDSKEIKLKKYFGFDFFKNEKEFEKRKKNIERNFRKRKNIELTMVEILFFLEKYSDGIKQFKNNKIEILKYLFRDYLENLKFNEELFKILIKIENEHIKNKQIEIDAKDLFFLMRNEKNKIYDKEKLFFSTSGSVQ